MSDEMTPERLEAILDGREPATDDEARDMLALAGALREAAPGAGPDLRARVRALPQPQPVGRLRRLFDNGWRGRMLIAAPALSAVVAVVIAVGVIGRSPGDNTAVSGAPAASSAEATATSTLSTTPAAPKSATPQSAGFSAADDAHPVAPITLRIAPATLEARLAKVRDIVAAAGGTSAAVDQGGQPPSSVVSITVPVERSADVLKAISGLAIDPSASGLPPNLSSTAQGAVRDALTPGALATLRLLVTETS
jgi:hypothetical protein